MASAGQHGESPGIAENGGRGVRHRVRRGVEAAKGKYAGSSAEHLWRRLDSMDFINRGLLFAATLLLCLFPFLIIANALAGWAGPGLRGAGGPVLLAVFGQGVLTGFWWFTIWFLLAGRIAWRDLFPAAVATAVFWLGMEAVFSVIFSGMVTSDDKKYGPIGVVFALMSWLIAIGVVIILGAVAGIVWRERNLSFRAALKKLRRDRSAP